MIGNLANVQTKSPPPCWPCPRWLLLLLLVNSYRYRRTRLYRPESGMLGYTYVSLKTTDGKQSIKRASI
jgi:hypothetical protein